MIINRPNLESNLSKVRIASSIRARRLRPALSLAATVLAGPVYMLLLQLSNTAEAVQSADQFTTWPLEHSEAGPQKAIQSPDAAK